MEQSRDRGWVWGIVVLVLLMVTAGACEAVSAVPTPTPVPRLAKYLGAVQGDCDVRITEQMYAELTGGDVGILMYQDGCTEAQVEEILQDFIAPGISVVATEVMEDIKANPTPWAIIDRAGEVMDDVVDVLEPALADGDFREWERDLICEFLPDWREILGEGRRVAQERGSVEIARRFEAGQAVVAQGLAECAAAGQ